MLGVCLAQELQEFFPVVEGEGSGGCPRGVPGFEFRVGASGEDAPGFHDARVLAGVPWGGKEWTSETLALDAGLESWIARGKGCYPGQEVVERAF